MKISFVILTWNSEKYILKCLDSLLRELLDRSFIFEVFVVDNGSDDNTAHYLNSYKKKYSNYIFPIFLKNNNGTTVSRNIALKRAKGDVVIVMDSDVEILKGTIEKLAGYILRNKDVGIVAPRLLYSDGNLQKSTDVFPTILSKLFRLFFLKRIEKIENKINQDGQAREVDYAISAMWVFKRDILKNVGLLDEKIFYAPEDVDFCIRVWKSGYKIIFFPEVSCIHHTQEISRGLNLNLHKIKHVLGLLYYFKKHKYFFRKPIFNKNH